jgi:hypothetical protein
MKEIFKLGNHIILGISLVYVEFIKSYQFMASFLLIHFIINYRIGKNKSLKIGIRIGDHGLFTKLEVGLN